MAFKAQTMRKAPQNRVDTANNLKGLKELMTDTLHMIHVTNHARSKQHEYLLNQISPIPLMTIRPFPHWLRIFGSTNFWSLARITAKLEVQRIFPQSNTKMYLPHTSALARRIHSNLLYLLTASTSTLNTYLSWPRKMKWSTFKRIIVFNGMALPSF